MSKSVVQDLRELRPSMASRLGVDEHNEGSLWQLRRQKLLCVYQVRSRYPARLILSGCCRRAWPASGGAVKDGLPST